MNFVKKAWFVLLFIALLLSACGKATQTPDDVSVMLTEGVGTMVAGFFGTQTAMFTPATNTPLATQTPFATPTLFPTPTQLGTPTLAFYTATLGTPVTATPTGTQYTPTVNPASLAAGCNNLGFIRDVTIPAGTELQPNQDFVKTWKVQNTGTCDWMYQYQLVLVGGDSFGGKSVKIQRRVTVNDWSEVSASMTAPRSPGTYTNYWRMMDTEGRLFGETLVASFKVAAPTAVPPTATFTQEPTLTPTP